ncbi:MAG: HD domain-containing protein [Oscillospiraceae bacterium]|nr:HD domain-containing protein [Oscillospiraceae bacterium]
MARELHKGDLTVDRLESQLKFLIEIDKMKNVQRQTLLADGSRRETDAEHSWHMAVMAMLLIEYAEDRDKIDIDRVVRMCLVHDLVEVYAGDTFCYDEAAKLDKPQREREAADRLFSLLPADQGTELRALWEEFDEAQSPDAAYAAAIDRIQPLINNHLTNGHTWRGGRVKAHQVYARMERIRHSSPKLYEYACNIIEENIKKGSLSE